MKTFLMTLAAGTALAAAPAMAQDTAPVDPFSGFHVEGLLGYDVAKAGSSIDDDSGSDNDQSIDGLAYGVSAGYDFRFGKFVVGPEAEVSWSTAKSKFDDGDFEDTGLGNIKANRDLYVGARVGYTLSPKTMVYVKGGYTNAKFDVRNSLNGTAFSQDIDADGWRAGAGVEQAITHNTFVKAEYRYSHYTRGEIDYPANISDSDRFKLDTDRHQIMVGAGVRF